MKSNHPLDRMTTSAVPPWAERGTIVALLVIQLGGATGLAVALGIVGFVVTVAGFMWYASREIARMIAEYRPMFPGPTEPAP